MTGLATPGENGEGFPFGLMRIVTGVAVETPALFITLAVEQELVLVAMDIHPGGVIVTGGLGKIISPERIAGPEAKKRMLFGVDTGMADGAGVEPLLPVEGGEVPDEARLLLFRMLKLPGGMLGGGTVTAFAVDAI